MIKTWNERLTREMPLTTAMQAEIDELRAKSEMDDAKLAALEAQEPVARFNWHLGKFEWLTKYNFVAHNMKPLFLAAADSTFNGKSAEYWNKLAVERWQENQKLEAKLAELEVMYLNSLADATQWQLYKARKDAVIAAGMGKKALRDSAAGAAPVQQVFGGRVDPSYVRGPMVEDPAPKEQP